MPSSQLLVDGFGRIREIAHSAVSGLTPAELSFRPAPSANSIAWLIWHLARVQDDHIADVAGTEQRWVATDWYGKFGLDLPPSATGYGHSAAQVKAVQVDSADLLTGYLDDVTSQTVEFVESLTETDYDRIVDERWDPPVTLAVRLVSVLSDDLQHAGQASYVRGLLSQ
jgi:DinB family protein